MKMSAIKFDCIIDNDITVLIAQLVYFIDCVHLFKKAFFYLSNSDFHTV